MAPLPVKGLIKASKRKPRFMTKESLVTVLLILVTHSPPTFTHDLKPSPSSSSHLLPITTGRAFNLVPVQF